jgi:hypothetical protein
MIARVRLRQNPRDAALNLNCFGVSVTLGVGGAAPVARRGTALVLETAAHRARDRDIHAAVTRSVVRRRVAADHPCDRGRRYDSDGYADHDEHDAAFARREWIGRWSFTSIGRRSLLRPANSIDSQ